VEKDTIASPPDVDERHFSRLNADKKSKFSTPDVDKKRRRQEVQVLDA
jgi:hypothetical protein